MNFIPILFLLFSCFIYRKLSKILLSDSFTIPFEYNNNLKHYLQTSVYFMDKKINDRHSSQYKLNLDLNCFTSWIVPEILDDMYLDKKTNAYGPFHAAVIGGDKGLVYLNFNDLLFWPDFTFIFITNITGVLDVSYILGLGRDGAFQKYITEHYKSGKFLINYQTKVLQGGKIVDEFLEKNSNKVAKINILPQDHQKMIYGYYCNLEFVYFSNDIGGKIYEDDYIDGKKIIYNQENFIFTNTFISRFETMTDKIKAPQEFIDYLEKNYFKGKNCPYQKIENKKYFICDEQSYNKCSDINFVFDGYDFRIPKEILFFQTDSKYYFNIVLNNKVKNFDWLIGNRFLLNFIPVFDSPNNLIYFIDNQKESFYKITFEKERKFKKGKIISKIIGFNIGICLLFSLISIYVKVKLFQQ